MYKNLSTQGLGIAGVESEIIELAVTYKFKGMDPDFMELYHRSVERGVPYAKRLVASARLKVGTFRLPTVWNDTDARYKTDMEKLPALAKAAAELGATRAVTLVAPACDERPYHENFEFHRKRLAEIGQALAAHGVKLGLEMNALAVARRDRAFEFVHKFDELRKLAIGVGSPNVGVVLDLWQWYAGGGSIDEIKQLTADQIVAVNLADAPADVPADQLTMQQRLLPGETNVVPSAEIVKWLSEIDYDGPVTARPDRTRFPKTGRVQIVRMIAESLNQVWIAAGLSVAAPLIPMVELATDEKADASADEEVEEEEVDETEVEAEVD